MNRRPVPVTAMDNLLTKIAARLLPAKEFEERRERMAQSKKATRTAGSKENPVVIDEEEPSYQLGDEPFPAPEGNEDEDDEDDDDDDNEDGEEEEEEEEEEDLVHFPQSGFDDFYPQHPHYHPHGDPNQCAFQ